MTQLYDILCERLQAQVPVALATVVVVDGGEGGEAGGLPALGAKLLVTSAADRWGTLVAGALDEAVVHDSLEALRSGHTSVQRYGPGGEPGGTEVEVMIHVFPKPLRMIICGAADFASALAQVGSGLGYHVTICDARPVFVTPARFPTADLLVVDWPHRYLGTIGSELGSGDALCILTHDHKFDVPTIVAGLATGVGYIGVMGSRRTHAERMERLRAAGVSEDELGRLMAPIGLDIGATTPEESAVAIGAEIIAVRSGRTKVASLRSGRGSIHGSDGSDRAEPVALGSPS